MTALLGSGLLNPGKRHGYHDAKLSRKHIMLARQIATLAFATIIAPVPALAHHPMDGEVVTTVWEGIASGVAHPVIGLDHLAFLVAAGLLASVTSPRIGVSALLAFLGAGLGGALLHLSGVTIGAVEALVALTVLVAGITLLVGTRLLATAAPAGLAVAFAVAGVLHGNALAEAIAGSPANASAAYLVTLALTQGAIGFGVSIAATRWGRLNPLTLQRRIAGIGTTVFGAVAVVMAVLG